MNKNKNIAVCLEHRFYQVNGQLYTKLSFPYYYWQDYLNYFDHVTIIARVKNVNEITNDMVQVNGPNVDFYPLPYYIGIKEFLLTLPKLSQSMFLAAKKYDYFLLRTGNCTNLLFPMLLLLRKPFLREYPGNIKEGIIGFAGNSFSINLLANLLHSTAKFQAKFSKANSFVSRYCCELYGSDKPGFIFSSFKSSEVQVRKTNYDIKNKVNIISVGRLEGEKGHINLLKAVQKLSNVQLHLIGNGGQKDALEDYANKHNINVKFYGAITDRDYLFNILCHSDIFIIPSLTEGMPRALLEAMTIGLPCIGSNVGGIPEVLDSNSLYNPQDVEQLKDKILVLIDNKNEREISGLRNKDFIKKHYSDKALALKKHTFWSKVYE